MSKLHDVIEKIESEFDRFETKKKLEDGEMIGVMMEVNEDDGYNPFSLSRKLISKGYSTEITEVVEDNELKTTKINVIKFIGGRK